MDATQKILSDVTVFNKYAKYLPEKHRRETWEEICDRNKKMHIEKFPQLTQEIEDVYRDFVVPKKVLPSMRSLQFAGRPIELNNARINNCCALPIDSLEAFSETFFLLLSGVGVGYSVQNRHVSKLPTVIGPTQKNIRYLISDDISGWANSIKVLMKAYFFGRSNPVFDYRDIREKGARLVTSGGKAPGPEPLKVCVDRVRQILEGAIGRQLSPLEAHDCLCVIADAVLSGGIRRAAMIALFSLEDEEMMTCKSQLPVENWELAKMGDSYQGYCIYKGSRRDIVLSQWDYDELVMTQKLPWYFFEPQRARANNSVVLHRKFTSKKEFMDVFQKIEASNAGEPGVFWTNSYDSYANPCLEVSLLPYQFCNLTEINASDVENQEDLNSRAKAASMLGSLQAAYTDFHYLRPIWKENTEKEALIGVSMTGIASGRVTRLNLVEAAEAVKSENVRIANVIGINPAARCTVGKPSGTTSCVLGTSSGIHAWHNDFYIRRMRVGKNEPLYAYMKKTVPHLVEDCFFKPNIEAVLSFPQKAPEGAILRTESFMDLLERTKRFNVEWVATGHRSGVNHNNISVTVSLKPDEWQQCAEWMWVHKSTYTGISLLPEDLGRYRQAPFENITEEQFNEMLGYLNEVDLTQVVETDDIVHFTSESACAGGLCEII